MTEHRPRRTVAAGLTLLALAAASCNGEPQAAEPTPEPSPEPTVVAETPTPTPTPEPTAEPTEEPTADPTDEPDPFAEPPPRPSLDGLIGEDYDALVTTHEAFRRWLYRYNPDPDELDHIYHPDCPCYDDERRLLAHYAENELRWTGGELEIDSVEVIDDVGRSGVVLHVTNRRVQQSYLVDAAGDVHDEIAPGTRTLELVFVRDSEESAWLLRTYSLIDDA